MDRSEPDQALPSQDDVRLPGAETAVAALPVPAPIPAAEAALAAAQALARQATAPATLRAYKADWTHYAAWCTAHRFAPVPAAPATVGAYLASLAESHAPSSIRRRLSAIGKMHRFNDLAWNPAQHVEYVRHGRLAALHHVMKW